MADPPFTRLLLATEHSEHDAGAESVAFELARRCAQPLHAVLPISYTAVLDMEVPRLSERADAEAARRREGLAAAAEVAGVELRLAVRHGAEPFLEIVEEARERAADLVVIRRRGRRGLLANLLLGEMVHKVVAHAPCSVLIVPRAATTWRRRVLAAVDPAGGPPERQLHPAIVAAAVARACALPLTIAAVAPPAADAATASAVAEALERAAAAARAAGVEAETLPLSGRVHEQLIGAAQRAGADLLVVGRHGETQLARAWIGGITQKVIGLAESPVLVSIPPSIPPPGRLSPMP